MHERKQYNYALLYIEGKPNMKDRYGKIGIILEDRGLTVLT